MLNGCQIISNDLIFVVVVRRGQLLARAGVFGDGGAEGKVHAVWEMVVGCLISHRRSLASTWDSWKTTRDRNL